MTLKTYCYSRLLQKGKSIMTYLEPGTGSARNKGTLIQIYVSTGLEY
jgi:hypothetical protein